MSEEQIERWADEAEVGNDVGEITRRGRGRPGRGTGPAQVVAMRLTEDELRSLDDIAARQQISRSEAIRRAVAQLAA